MEMQPHNINKQKASFKMTIDNISPPNEEKGGS